MTPQEKERAYKAIDEYVRKYVKKHKLFGEEANLCCACHSFFDRHEDEFDEEDGIIEAFANVVAKSCLYIETNKFTRRKRREEAYADLLLLDRGETAEERRVYALVNEALEHLPDDKFAIMVWDIYKSGEYPFDLHRLAEVRGVSWGWFHEGYLEPARDAFAEAFGKVVGNEKWYAKLRLEQKKKKKGQNDMNQLQETQLLGALVRDCHQSIDEMIAAGDVRVIRYLANSPDLGDHVDFQDFCEWCKRVKRFGYVKAYLVNGSVGEAAKAMSARFGHQVSTNTVLEVLSWLVKNFPW